MKRMGHNPSERNGHVKDYKREQRCHRPGHHELPDGVAFDAVRTDSHARLLNSHAYSGRLLLLQFLLDRVECQ
jgi:hypothetical protein